MFKKKPSSQGNPYQNNTSNIGQKLKTPISSSKFNKAPHISINNFKQQISKRTPQYSNRSKNSGYHQQQQNDYIAEDSYRSEQQSTLSYNEYKDIVSNLLENGDQDLEWVKMPQTLKLVIKALHLSMNSLQSKVIENREIINDHGIQSKDYYLQLQELKKNLKKINIKLINPTNDPQLTQDNLTTPLHLNNQPLTKSHINIYQKGLDMIMIEQVKTITDAIISQKSTQIINQVNEMNFKIQQKIVGEIQELKDKFNQEYAKKKDVQDMQLLVNQQALKLERKLKEQLSIVEEQIQHLNRQLITEKQAMCDFAHYVQDTFMSKNDIDQLLKTNQPSQPKPKPTHQNDFQSNPILSRNKIDQIVKNHFQSTNLFMKRKDFEQFRDRINAQIFNFATVSQVQAIVDKSTKTKLSKLQQMNHTYAKSQIPQQDQPTLQLKKLKYHSKPQDQPRQKSPNLVKKKSSTYKTSQSRVQLSKVSKPSKHPKRTSSNYEQQLIESSPISQHNKSRSKTFKQPNVDINSQSESKYNMEKLWSKFETRINSIVQTVKQNCLKKVQLQTQSLQKRVTKRLQAAQEEFCSVVEQNWRTMTAKNLKVQKAQKQNMQHLLNIFSQLNIIARYTTIVNCNPNQCIKWDKQVFNAQSKTFYLNSQKTHLYIAAAGVYQVHVVFYTLYDPVISFGVQLNSEEIYNTKNNAIKQDDGRLQKQASEVGTLSKRDKKSKIIRKDTHPSRGMEYSQTLLIPAKSHLVIRMVEQMSGQGLFDIRKL